MLCRHVFGKISSEFRGISSVFVYFAGFRGFTWNSRLRDREKNQKPCNICLIYQVGDTDKIFERFQIFCRLSSFAFNLYSRG